MSIRIAVATKSGKVIDKHFGRAEAFHIVDLDEKENCYIEKRETTRLCQEHEHNESALEKMMLLLHDCSAVLASKVGVEVKRKLEIVGIAVFEVGLPVDEALEKLKQYYYKGRGGSIYGQEN